MRDTVTAKEKMKGAARIISEEIRADIDLKIDNAIDVHAVAAEIDRGSLARGVPSLVEPTARFQAARLRRVRKLSIPTSYPISPKPIFGLTPYVIMINQPTQV